MLVSVQFPIIDLRFALAQEAAPQLPLPDFVRPRSANRYLHFHGGFIDDALCRAGHALRLIPSLSTQKIGPLLGITPQVYTFRFRQGRQGGGPQRRRHPGRLLAPGEKGSVYFEISFCDRAEQLLQARPEHSSSELESLLEGYLALPVQVPGQHTGQNPPLAEAGSGLAQLFHKGTTPQELWEGEDRWVQGATPVATVKYMALPGLRLPAGAVHVQDFPAVGITLSYSYCRRNRQPVRVWWAGIDPERFEDRDSRNTQHQLCQYLQGAHLQAAYTFALLDQLDALGAGQQQLRKEDVISSLDRTLAKLSQNYSYGFYQPLLKPVVIDDPRWLGYRTKVAGSGDEEFIERYQRVTELLRLQAYLAGGDFASAYPILEYLLSDDQAQTAIEYLLPYCRQPGEHFDAWRTTLMQCQSRIRHLDKRYDSGKLDNDTYFAEYNRITVTLMGVIGEMG